MDFTKIDNRGGQPFYVKASKDDVVIINPGNGAVTLTKEAAEKILNFRRMFDYSRLRIVRQKRGASVQPDTIEFNVLNSGEESSEMVIVRYTLPRNSDSPDVAIVRVDPDTASKKGELQMSYDVFDVVVREMAKSGIKPKYMELTNIVEVEKLPAETAARNDVVYQYQKKLYKLNADEDELEELTGTIEEVKILPEFSTSAEEDVLYNLGYGYFDQQAQQKFEQGVYTYAATGNLFTLEDLKVNRVGKLPAVKKAKENVIYVLTRDDAEAEAEEGSAWKLNQDKTELVEETRKIVNCTKLPYVKLAVKDAYYIINKGVVKKANTADFTTVGALINVDRKGLPNIGKIQLNGSTVYILKVDQTLADGTAAKKGDMFIFDVNAKEFIEYDVEDPPEIGFDVVEATQSEEPAAPEPASKTKVTVPTLKDVTEDNGTWTATFNDYDESKMNVAGGTATVAGAHSATFSLKDTDTTEWADGTSGNKVVPWTAQAKTEP